MRLIMKDDVHSKISTGRFDTINQCYECRNDTFHNQINYVVQPAIDCHYFKKPFQDINPINKR